MVYRYVSHACPAEMFPTLWLKTRRLSVLKESVQVKLVMFMTGQFSFKYGRFLCTACREDKAESSSRQDGYSMGQDGLYLILGLRRFQHCTGHITTGSWKGRGNQYIQLVKVCTVNC